MGEDIGLIPIGIFNFNFTDQKKGQKMKQSVSSTIMVGDLVERVNSDYKFVGTVVSEFKKTTGLIRYVVEDDRGVLFIWRRENFEKK